MSDGTRKRFVNTQPIPVSSLYCLSVLGNLRIHLRHKVVHIFESLRHKFNWHFPSIVDILYDDNFVRSDILLFQSVRSVWQKLVMKGKF